MSVYVYVCVYVGGVPSCLFLQDGGGAMAGFVAASRLRVSKGRGLIFPRFVHVLPCYPATVWPSAGLCGQDEPDGLNQGLSRRYSIQRRGQC